MQHACVFVSEWYRWNTGNTYSTTGSLQTEIIIRLWKGVESFQKGKHLVAGNLLATVLLRQEPTFSTITVARGGKTSQVQKFFWRLPLWLSKYRIYRTAELIIPDSESTNFVQFNSWNWFLNSAFSVSWSKFRHHEGPPGASRRFAVRVMFFCISSVDEIYLGGIGIIDD